MRFCASGLVLAVIGCGESEPVTVTVTVQTGQPPAVIAFRDEASPEWATPITTNGVTFEAEVAGPYRVVVACESTERKTPFGSLFSITQYARTPADELRIDHACPPTYDPTPFSREGLAHGGERDRVR